MSGASLGVALPRWRVALVYLSWATLAVAGALGLFAIAVPVCTGDWIELVSLLALAVSVAFSVEFRVYVSRSTMSRPLSFGFAMTASYLVIDPAWQVWGVFALGVAVAMATSFRPLRMALHGAGRIVMGAALFFVVMEGGEALRLPILLVAPLGVIVYAGFCQSYEFVRLRGTSDNFVPEQHSLAWGGVWAYVLGGSLIVVTLQFLTNYAVESMPGVNSSLSVALVNMFLSIVLLVLSFTNQVRRINQRLHGVVSAALAMPWGRGSERREAAVRFANAALGRRNARLQTHRPGEHDLGALLEKTGDGEVFLVVSRPAGDIPFNTEDTEVLEALGHISRESRKVLENERSLSRDAYQDSLTGLPNYRAFQELLVSANDERTELQGLAVLFADIDDLKRINDVLGHDAGNDLIRRTAAAITDTVRIGDTVARVGGDEFVVVLRNLRSLEQGEQIAQRIVERTSRIETLLDSTKFTTSVSIGLSFSAHREADLDKLVSEAENNMRSVKKAKKAGSSVVSVIASSRRSSLVDAAVSEAISSQVITIAVQPIISLTTMTITGVEVLARLQNSPLGRISPTVLVEKAKALGLLNDLTLQILNQALAASRRFTEIVPGLTAVCVNAELSQFGDGRFTEAVLAAARDNPDVKVVMELNERSITGVTPEFRAQAERLRAGGVLLSLDEYGAPASSLATVIELPLDYVKVDRHLVSDMAVDDRQRDLLAAFVRLAEQLGIVMIVEGVEEEATHDALVALGVPRVQGFYYGRPMSVEAMLERLSTHGPAATV